MKNFKKFSEKAKDTLEVGAIVALAVPVIILVSVLEVLLGDEPEVDD